MWAKPKERPLRPVFIFSSYAWAAGLFATVLLIDVLCPVSVSFDSRWTVPVVLNLLDRGTTHVDEYVTPTKDPGYARLPGLFIDYAIECVTPDGRILRAQPCTSGHYYNWYPTAVPVLASPVVFGLRGGLRILSPVLRLVRPHTTPVLSAFLARDFINSRGFVEVVVASFFVALTTVVIFFVGRLYLPDSYSAVLAMAFAFATPAWSTASRALVQHGPSMLMVSTSLYMLLLAGEDKRRQTAWLISLAAIPTELAYFIRPTNSLWVGAVSLYVLARYRRHFVWYVLCAAPMAIAFVIYNEFLYHQALPTYFLLQTGRPSLPRDVIPILRALAGVLISPSRGLFIYSPIFCFSIWGMVWAIRHRWCTPLALYLVAVVAGNWLLLGYYFPLWFGGHSYGPRLLSDLSPLFIFFLVPALMNWHQSAQRAPKSMQVIFVTLLCASVLVHSRGARSEDVYLWNVAPADVDQNPARLWDWRDPQFLRGLSWERSLPTTTQNLHRSDVAPRYYVDEALTENPHNLQTGIFDNSILRVSGWALDPTEGTAGGVEVVIDSKLYAARYGLERPDVATVFENVAYTRSGFAISIPARQLTAGPHRFSVRIIDKGGTTYFESAPAQIAPLQ